MNLVIEKLEKKDLKEAISIYDENHSLKTNYEKLLAICDTGATLGRSLCIKEN